MSEFINCTSLKILYSFHLIYARRLIKERNLDPVPLSDYSTQNSKWSKFELYNGNLYGLSELRRSGPMLLGFDSNTIYMTVHLGVENLRGKCLKNGFCSILFKR